METLSDISTEIKKRTAVKIITASSPAAQHLFIWLLCLVFLIIIIRNAWLGDDAYITLRTIDNFIHGLGLRWNIAERVQVFTHPLWLFTLAIPYSFTREAYFTAITVSLTLSVISCAWLLYWLPGAVNRVAVFLLLLSSTPFIDYSTSGLENPLSHLLLLFLLSTYYAEYSPRRYLKIALACGLLMVNRLDMALFAIPVLIAEGLRHPFKQAAITTFTGLCPLILWEAFALIYYGALLPNTYYAKVATGIPAYALISQGCIYFLDAIKNHPSTILVIICGIGAGVFKRDHKSLLVSLMIALYLAYIVKVGGDFMSGRFFTVPFLAAVMNIFYCIQNFSLAPSQRTSALCALAALAAVLIAVRFAESVVEPVFISSSNRIVTKTGITDEKAYYFGKTGLVNIGRNDGVVPYHPWIKIGMDMRAQAEQSVSETVTVAPSPGMCGYFAGPKVYLIDSIALTDPFLSRIPCLNTETWRVGHYFRDVSQEYIDSRVSGEIRLSNPRQRELLEKINLITRGDIFSAKRLRAILNLMISPPQLDFSIRHYVNESFRLYQKGDYRQAIEAGLQTLSIDTANADAYNNICAAYNALRDWDKAIESCQKALDLNPAHDRAQANLNWAREQKIRPQGIKK